MSVRNDIIDNLMTAAQVLVTSGSYPTKARHVVAYQENYLTKFRESTPIVMVIDQGNEQLLVEDTTHQRYAFDVAFWGYIAKRSWDETEQELNNIVAALKQFMDSDPSLGSNVLEFQFVEGQGHNYDAEQKQALTFVTARIVYWCEKGSY